VCAGIDVGGREQKSPVAGALSELDDPAIVHRQREDVVLSDERVQTPASDAE
jgi:hypothetical protein